MLTTAQARYLLRLSVETAEKIVHISPWDSRGLTVAETVERDIKSVEPKLEIVFLGSMALHIAGQKDIDFSVISPASEFPYHQKKLEKVFGQPDKLGLTSIAWHFKRNEYDVGIYLSDPVTSTVQEQIDVFNILKNDVTLLKEYEAIKFSMNGKTYQEYQTAKYEFYNRILGIRE